MRDNIHEALKLIAGSEGGYSNHPNDPGGPTMKGVTLAKYKSYCKLKGRGIPSVNDLKKITDAEVEEIFRMDYWNSVRGDELPAGLDYITADFAFNSGSGQAVKELQRVVTALGYDTEGADGKMGRLTLAAIDAAMTALGEDKVINAYMDKRLAFMKSLKTWSTFGKGWTNRVRDVRKNGLSIAHGDPTYLPVAHPMGNAKADPAAVKMTSIPGGASTVTTVGGAVATAATTAGTTLLDNSSTSGDTHYMLYAILGFVVLTVIASLVTFFVLKNKPAEEGTV